MLLSTRRATPGLRRPGWLDRIGSCGISMGSTAESRHQTLYALERAACGMGLEYTAAG